MSKEISLQETGKLLLDAKKIVLCTHVSPDGDTLGSSLGLAQCLQKLGKEVIVYCDDLVNKSFSFIPGIELLQRPDANNSVEADLLVVIDASSFDRIGISLILSISTPRLQQPVRLCVSCCRKWHGPLSTILRNAFI